MTLSSLAPGANRNCPTCLNWKATAHDEPDAVAAGERYFPDGMVPQAFYQPVPRGLEIKISDRVAQLRALAGDGRAGPDKDASD